MPSELICSKCGTPNAPEDQFCGSCGAFLEWQQTGTKQASSPAPFPASQPDPSSPAPASPPDAPQPISSKLAEAPAGGTVSCAACGTANPIGRAFCQRCGLRLAAEPAKPITEPVSAAPASAARGDGRRGGLPGWLPIVIGLGAVIGLVVGGAALLPSLLDGAGSSASSTPVRPSPSLAPTLTPTVPAGAGGSPSPTSPSPGSPSVAPTSAASSSLTLTGAKASSVVGNREMFSAGKVIDGRLDTSWQEGATQERGQWIEVTFDPATVDYLVISSGYQLSRDAYLANRRPRDVLVSIDGGAAAPFSLADSEQPQRLDLDGPSGATRVRIEVVSTYDPEATAYPGSPFDDMAISEIQAFGFPASVQ